VTIRARQRRMSAQERLAQALALGRKAVAAYAAAHGVDEGEARERLERAAQAGRLPSRVMRQLAESRCSATWSASSRGAGVGHALIGAAALAVHGVSRATAGVDLLTVDADVSFDRLRTVRS
jgi:hypothetical protein